MNTSQAINSVYAEIKKNDSSLYVFQPENINTRFFIGEAILSGAATVIISAFIKGLSSALEKKAENLGGTVGNWMYEKLESLFLSKDISINENVINKEVGSLRESILKIDNTSRDEIISKVENTMISTFKESGMTKDRATAIAASARQAAIGLIGGD